MARRPPDANPPGRIEILDGWIDLAARCVHRHHEVHLTPIETRLLGFLAARASQPCTKEELLEQVWGYHPQSQSRAVEATVLRLRQKLERDPTQPAHLQTVWGTGFRFVPGTQPAAPARRRFHGHTALLATLVGLEGVCLLVGPGGIGKTRLAEEVLARRSGVFCELAACRTAHEALLQICWTLGIEADADPAHTVERVAAALPGRGLVVLDNLEQLADFDPVLRRLHRLPGIVVLGTTRHAVYGIPAIELPPLEHADALALLQSLVDPPPARCESLLARTGGMPLAIELAANQLDVLTEDEVVAGLDTRQLLRDSLARSLELLPPTVQQGYRRLASLPPLDLPLEVVQAVLGAGSLDAMQLLVQRSLLTRRTLDGRSQFRIPMGLYPDAADGVKDPGVAARAAEAWLVRTEPIAARLEQGDGAAEDELNTQSALGLALLDAELRPMLRARVLACLLPRLHAQGQLAACWSRIEALLADELEPELAERLRTMGAETLVRMGRASAALDLLVDPPSDTPDLRRRRDHVRGGALRALGRVAEALAILDAELEVSELTEAQRGAIHNSRALCLASLDRPEAAYEAALLARTLLLENGRLHDRLAAYNTLGNLALRAGDDGTARAWLDGALPLAELHGRHTLGVVRTNLANLQICAGELDEAALQLQAALEDHRWSGRSRGAGLAMHHLGRLELLRHRFADALRELSSAQVILEQCGEQQLVDWTRCFTSIALAELGDVARAGSVLDGIPAVGTLERLAHAHLARALGRPFEPIDPDACPRELRPHAVDLGKRGSSVASALEPAE